MKKLEDMLRLVKRARHEGRRDIARRLIRRAYQHTNASELDFPLLSGDISDSATLIPSTPPRRARKDGPLTIGWLTTPPSAGSGGHTTMFRMIQSLEQAGHTCVLFLYDRHHGDMTRHAEVIATSWPWIRAEVRDVADGLGGVDACVATGWQTAHVLATRSSSDLHQFYFIQDYEPFFYPHGSEYELAADSYRFGFRNIALGHMVHDRLLGELSVPSALVPFSCDTSTYRHTNSGIRSGVVFYTKPQVARRGYLLGALALEEFHRRHPEQPIHIYGDPVPEISIPVTRHERLTPTALNDLYNSTIAGLAMSFTNISLVAEEMLAAGTIPVVNDSVDSRADLSNDYVAWSAPTPSAIADALCRVVERHDLPARSVQAAASVRTDNWAIAGTGVVQIIEEAMYTTEQPISRLVSEEAAGPNNLIPTAGSLARAMP